MIILFVNHSQIKCGVYQYGKRVSEILKKDQRFTLIYKEIDDISFFENIITEINPNIIVYNWHQTTLSWLNNTITTKLKSKKQLIIYHESVNPSFLHYDGLLMTDLSEDMDKNKFSLPRPIFDIQLEKEKNSIPKIGSFGFGFENKGFERICSIVQNNFDEAIIHLHITNAFFGDNNSTIANKVIDNCRKIIKNPSIELKITTDFIDDESILKFLNSNSINMFLYDNMNGRGLSSVVDYAISVNTPMVLNNSFMFRHIISEKPEISIENNNILSIIEKGSTINEYFRNKWSNQNFRDKFYKIIKD